MNTIHERLKVFCKDDKNEYEILCPDYEEKMNEINIKTPARNSDLYRGWIGDLLYITGISRNVVDSNKYTNLLAEETYKDVLLISVKNLTVNGNITWEYTFLKK